MFKVQKFQSTGFQIYSNQKEIKYISPSNIRSESVLKLAHPSYNECTPFFSRPLTPDIL